MTSLPERLRSVAGGVHERGKTQAILREAADELDRRAVRIQRLEDVFDRIGNELERTVWEEEPPGPGWRPDPKNPNVILTDDPVEDMRQRDLAAGKLYAYGTDPPLEEPEGRLVVDRYVTRREMSHALAVMGAVILNPDVRVGRSK